MAQKMMSQSKSRGLLRQVYTTVGGKRALDHTSLQYRRSGIPERGQT